MIKRQIEDKIKNDFGKGNIILVLGARKVGKTTLLEQLSRSAKRPLLLNCDNAKDREKLSHCTASRLASLVGKADLLLIDEAQKVTNIGLTLQKLANTLGKRTQVVATGTSELGFSGGLFESDPGRVRVYPLYPFSFSELAESLGNVRSDRRPLASRIVLGSYPEVVTTPDDASRILEGIVNDISQCKDLRDFGGIRRSDVLMRLLQCVALQVGSDVSYAKLASETGINKITVESYIDLLEKTFVVFRVVSLSRNSENEIRKGRKIYFWDNGVRNAIIGKLAPPPRKDIDVLWENYLVSERKKALAYAQSSACSYFWRTTELDGVDYVEERDGYFSAYEFRCNPCRDPRPPVEFLELYPNSEWDVISPKSYIGFLTNV